MNKRIYMIALAILLVAATVFSAVSCTGTRGVTTVNVENEEYYNQLKDKNITLNVFNWGEYISDGAEEGSLNINQAFEELTGITVNYTNFDSNETLYSKIKNGGAQYDIIIPSDYMIARLIAEGELEKINFDNIPNLSKIEEHYTGYDPTNEYSVSYTWGMLGIVYNKTMVDEADLTGWEVLWNEKYKGDILMIRNSRDALGIALLKNGYSLNTENEEEIRKAAEDLKKQKPLVQAYVMDQVFDKMERGEAAMAPYYAGDAMSMIENNPDLAFYIPDKTNIFEDAICIPKGCTGDSKLAAEMYINFLCETEVAKANCDYICYATRHTGAKALLDEEVLSNEALYPSQEKQDNAEYYVNLSENTKALYDQMWGEIMGSASDGNAWIIMVIAGAMIVAVIAVVIVRKKIKVKNNY